MGKTKNFKFGRRIDVDMSHLADDKIPRKEGEMGPYAKFLNYGPFHKFGMGVARNIKFCTQTYHR